MPGTRISFRLLYDDHQTVETENINKFQTVGIIAQVLATLINPLSLVPPWNYSILPYSAVGAAAGDCWAAASRV